MRLKATLVLIAATSALALISIPAAFAAGGPNPDTRDAARSAQAVNDPAFSGPSPDARDAAIFAPQSSPTRTDLRSPDTRDVANGVAFGSAPQVQVISGRRVAGFQWGDAGIGAGTVMAFVVLGAGGLLLVHRRQRSRSRPSASALPIA